jgi:hypothetical protein
MHKKRPGLSSIFACCLALGATLSQAAGFGDTGSGAVLGQPLDFVVQLRVEASEALEPQCVTAEVTAGDRRLPAQTVRAQLERAGPESMRVRVTTTQSIDEPVVGILLQVGCGSRLSRRFVVLADPPTSVQAPSPAGAAVPLVLPGGPLVGEQGAVAEPAAGGGLSGVEAPARSGPVRLPRPSGRQAGAPQQVVAAVRAPEPKPAVAASPVAPKVAAAPVKAERAEPMPRLKLDLAEPRPDANQAVEQALEAVAEAASATRAANAAASAAEQRIATLERTMEQMRSEARQNRAEANEMRERLRRGEGASAWTWPLVVGLLLLLGLAAWLARELTTLRRAQQRTWQQGLKSAQAQAALADLASAAKIPTSPIPFVTSEVAVRAGAGSRRGVAPGRAWPPPAPAQEFSATTLPPDTQPPPLPTSAAAEERANLRTMPLPPVGYGPDAGSPRDVSIEELIDLEQQADFFVVLGQDEAAVDLLVEHLRSTGGGSPLPYLKLLEIHHRRGDHAAYDRTRSRFNQRFNAYAPDWDSGLQHGRSLEDYAGILPRLQQVWPQPLDAMAELEALLFRKSRGDLFDLPAYRDVLFLYSLARDMLDREAVASGDVDLLLPLADGGDFGATTPHPYFGLEHDSVFDSGNLDDVPTAPVDLDLTTSERPAPPIFDTLPVSPGRGPA